MVYRFLGNIMKWCFPQCHIWAVTCDFQQCGILTCVDSDEPLQPPFKLKNSKWCSVSSLTIIEYSSDEQRLWSDCTYAQADLRLCWSHIPHCWKSRVAGQITKLMLNKSEKFALIKSVWNFCLSWMVFLIIHVWCQVLEWNNAMD